MMGVVLSIIAIGVLLILIIASLRQNRGSRQIERHAAEARAEKNRGLHEDAQRNQAATRAAWAARSAEPSAAPPEE
jgi:septal ring-binding cell division protein DamX